MLFPNAKEMTIALDKYLLLAEGWTGKHPLVDRIFSDNVKCLAKADQVCGAVIKRDIDQTLRAYKAGAGAGGHNQNQPTARRTTL